MVRREVILVYIGDGYGQARRNSRNVWKVKFTGFSNFLDLVQH